MKTNKQRQAKRKNQPKKKNQQVTSVPLARAVTTRRNTNPVVRSSSRSVTISHVEEFAPVLSTGTGFQCFTYFVQPGVATCFPWLSAIAGRYEKYKFRSLTFRYISQVPATSTGAVVMAFDFDVNDNAPVSMIDARSYHDRAVGVVWQNPITLQLDLSQGDKALARYVRVGLPTGYQDLKTFDLGAIHVCVEGVAAGEVGYIEAAFVVELFTPQIQNPIGGLMTSTTGCSAAALFGTASAVDPQAALPFGVLNTSTITFTQRFEGFLSCTVGGGTLSADVTPTVGGPAGSLCTAAGNQIVNAGATAVQARFAVRAVPGTTISFAMTAASVSGVSWFCGSAAYLACLT